MHDQAAGKNALAEILIGLYALETGLVKTEELLAALQFWGLDRSIAFRKILMDHFQLNHRAIALFQGRIDEDLKKHGGNLKECVAAHESAHDLLPYLIDIADQEIRQAFELVTRGVETETSTQTALVDQSQNGSQRFLLIEKISEGGHGEIWAAQDTELGRQVAVKLVNARHATDDYLRRQLVREAEMMGRMNHPGIPPIYSLGRLKSGDPFFAMKFVPKGDFQYQIRQFHQAKLSSAYTAGQRAIEFQNLVQQLIQICQTMQYAHAAKIIHRDLKPGNILVGDFGEIFVTDWGCARSLGGDHTDINRDSAKNSGNMGSGHASPSPASRVGSMSYIPPEQFHGRTEEQSPRSDIFCIGGILYAILTGKAPFEKTAQFSSEERAADFHLIEPVEINKSVDPALQKICMKALMFHQRDRYQTAGDMADDLKRWLADEPVAAWPNEPAGRRVRRWMKRHRSIVSVAVSISIAGFVGLLAHDIQMRWERDQTRIAEQKATKAKQKAEIAEQTARIERNHAVASTEKAIVNSMRLFEQVAGDMRYVPGNESDRLALSELVRKDLEDYLAVVPEDLELQLRLVGVIRESANIARYMGQYDVARPFYDQAIGRANLHASDLRFMALKIQVLADYADMELARNEIERARQWIEQAAGLLSKVGPEENMGLNLMLVLATADLWFHEGNYDKAIQHATAALGLLEKAAFPEEVTVKLRLVGLDLQGESLLKKHQHKEALERYSEIIRLAESRNQIDPDYRYFLATALYQRVESGQGQGRTPAEIAADHEKSMRMITELTGNYPSVASYKELRQKVKTQSARLRQDAK